MLGVPVCLLPLEFLYSPGDAEGLTRGPGHHDNPTSLVQTRLTAAKWFGSRTESQPASNRRLDPLTKITGARASSLLPAHDTPHDAEAIFPRRDGLSHAAESTHRARAAWQSTTSRLAGTPHVRVSRDGRVRRVRPRAGAPAHVPHPGRQRYCAFPRMPSYTWSSTRPQKRRRPGTRPGHPTTIPYRSFRSALGWRPDGSRTEKANNRGQTNRPAG